MGSCGSNCKVFPTNPGIPVTVVFPTDYVNCGVETPAILPITITPLIYTPDESKINISTDGISLVTVTHIVSGMIITTKIEDSASGVSVTFGTRFAINGTSNI